MDLDPSHLSAIAEMFAAGGAWTVALGGLLPIDQTLYDRASFSGRMLKPFLLQELLDEVSRQLSGDGRA